MEATPCTGKPNALPLRLGPLLLIPVCSGVWAYINGENKCCWEEFHTLTREGKACIG